MRWIVRGLIGLGLLVVLAMGALLILDLPNRPAEADLAAIQAKAQAYEVRIRRAEWGVPHILGRRNADAAFGLAYAHAEDDFATIQDVALATRGQLAGKDGLKAAPTDYIVSLLEVWKTTEAGYDGLPADVRAVLEGYADGINLYGAEHPDAVAPGLLPLTGKDIAAGFIFKTPFFYGLDGELKRLNELPADPTPKGSNGVAVAPSRSADGATRLLVNSHQPFTGPVAWYEAVVQSGEGWHVAGGFFPGSPFMLHGHNATLGWANTVNTPDLIDTYRLVVNPKNANQYRLDGQWKEFERSQAKLRIKLWGPFHVTVNREVLRTVHGPVMKTKAGAFALRYAGMGEARQPLQYWRLNLARDAAEWRAAMAIQALPSINYIYADQSGTIGYVYNGLFPDRPDAKVDWQGVLPGDRSELIWKGYLPFDKVPQIWAPKGGLVFNANNTPFQATGPGDGLDPRGFPASMGIQTDMTNRSWRELETFGADLSITPEEFLIYKFDVAYSTRSEVATIRKIALLGPTTGGDGLSGDEFAEVKNLLQSWDLRADRKSRTAALGILTAWAVKNDPETPSPWDALRKTAGMLKKHFGRVDPEWGEVNRLVRGGVNLAVDGGPDTLRAIYGKPGKDGRLSAMGGDTFIMVVSWDRQGRLSSQSIHQFGSATLDAKSKHYADQAPLFATHRFKPVLFTEEQLKSHIVEDYRPGKRSKKLRG